MGEAEGLLSSLVGSKARQTRHLSFSTVNLEMNETISEGISKPKPFPEIWSGIDSPLKKAVHAAFPG